MLIMVMSTGALASASVAHNAPKPEPMTTTRCRPDPSLGGVRAADAVPEVSTDIVLSSLSMVPCRLLADWFSAEPAKPRHGRKPRSLGNRPSGRPNRLLPRRLELQALRRHQD